MTATTSAQAVELLRLHRSDEILSGSLPPARLQELGVARIFQGRWTQRVALRALADAAATLLVGGELPAGTRALN